MDLVLKVVAMLVIQPKRSEKNTFADKPEFQRMFSSVFCY